MNIIKITNNLVNNRIDKILSNIYTNLTRTKIQEYIKNGCLLKNNEIFTDNSYKVKLNEVFTFNPNEKEELKLKETEIPLNIIYEDEYLLVINKQSNLSVHPNSKEDKNTLVNTLLKKYKNNLSHIGGELRPGIVHRLDKDTTGLMVIAKNDEIHINLKEQLEKRILKRKYKGIIWGVFTPRVGKIETYLKRSKTNPLKIEISSNNNDRYSLTNYKTIKTYLNNSISLIEFELDTGRTHQIRVHCNYLKHPIVGDSLYGGKNRFLKNEFSKKIQEKINNFSRQALHSYKLNFIHPITKKELKFETDLPSDMKNLIDMLEKHNN